MLHYFCNFPGRSMRVLLAGTATLALGLALSNCAGMEQMYRDSYCDYNGAYKKGMNDARAGNPMDVSASRVCAPEQKSAADQGYREGYTEAVRSQPSSVTVNLNGRGGGGYEPEIPQCRSSGDCGFGKFCRDRGNGNKVCMGDGAGGAPCVTSGDCGSGLFCRTGGSGRHAGYRRCGE